MKAQPDLIGIIVTLPPHIPLLEQSGKIEAKEADGLLPSSRSGFPQQLDVSGILVERHDAVVVLLIVVAHHPAAHLRAEGSAVDALDKRSG
jgi:hypothetical protein